MLNLSLLDLYFILLLIGIAALRRFCPPQWFPLFGAIASAAAIGIASWKTLATIAGITLFYLFPVHLLWRQMKGASARQRRVLLACSIAGLVLLFIVFKTYRIFEWSFGGLWRADWLLTTVGFSYFVLRAIGFLHIQSILEFRDRTPWRLLFFMLFPPTFTSGPIQKYQDFVKQVGSPLPLTRPVVMEAAYRITRGYFRKAVVAYILDEGVKQLLGLPAHNVLSSVVLIVCLYLFFYFDFAGYSDVAIGFGALMGIRVPENFKQPLLTTSITEFWRHWHITLVDWFRDNVFVPLGGMQSSRSRAALLGLLIMTLSGLWHGFATGFLLWGLWHGSLLFLEAMTNSKPLPPTQRHGGRYWGRVMWTNAKVALGGLLFLPLSSVQAVLEGFARWY